MDADIRGDALAKFCRVAEIPVRLSAWIYVTVWVSCFPRVGAFGLLVNIVSQRPHKTDQC